MERLFITNFVCNDDFTVKLSFNDNTTQTVDVGSFIRKNPHPQYNRYLKLPNFKKAKIEHGNIVWGKNWDLIFPVHNLHAGIVG